MDTIIQIEELREKQLSFFSSGITKDVKFRKELLSRLREAILRHDKEICEGLHRDLNKSSFEAYATETGLKYPPFKNKERLIRIFLK
jgi:aldehyde dehydrogenase (NAD+)